MDSAFLWAQIFGFFGLLMSILRMQLKNPRYIALAETPAGLMWAVQYYLINAQAGMIINIVCMFRGVAVYAFPAKAMRSIVTGSVIIIVGTVLYNAASWHDFLPIIGTVLYSVSCLFRDNRPLMVRIILLHCIPWLLYNILVFSVFGAVSSVLGILSGIIGMARHEGWEIGRCYRSFIPSISRALFNFSVLRTYP